MTVCSRNNNKGSNTESGGGNNKTCKKSNNENIQVAVRVRNLPPPDDKSCWIVADKSIVQAMECNSSSRSSSDIRKRTAYAFDNVFSDTHNSGQVYKTIAEPIVLKSMQGYNGTIMAYGQTNSGKTYTMKGSRHEPGIIPLALQDVFNYIRESSTEREFLLRVSYMEIYNEVINDLLSPGNKNGTLTIMEDPLHGTVVKGLSEHIVVTLSQVMTLLASGEAYRHVGWTDFNAASSRSHAILRLVIESEKMDRTDGDGSVVMSKEKGGVFRNTPRKASSKESNPVTVGVLNLIDLAGSERISTDTTRRKEGAFINKSLLTLGNVISKLSAGNTSHVPYRDSKLTRILQKSLDGNALIGVICTISPCIKCIDESVKTMNFAQRAKKIEVNASISELVGGESTLLKQYRDKIKMLEQELKSLTPAGINKSVSKIIQENEEMQNRLRERDAFQETMKERINQLTKMILTGNSSSSCHNGDVNEDGKLEGSDDYSTNLSKVPNQQIKSSIVDSNNYNTNTHEYAIVSGRKPHLSGCSSATSSLRGHSFFEPCPSIEDMNWNKYNCEDNAPNHPPEESPIIIKDSDNLSYFTDEGLGLGVEGRVNKLREALVLLKQDLASRDREMINLQRLLRIKTNECREKDSYITELTQHISETDKAMVSFLNVDDCF